MAWLQRLPLLPREELPDQTEIEATVEALTRPARPEWVLARVAALLLPYFEKDTPQSVREMEAEDWLEALGGLPEWAIVQAVRWWKGPNNPDRRRRPLEGDIAKVAREQTSRVRAVPRLCQSKRKPVVWIEPSPPKPRITPERAREIMEAAGFAVKRFGGPDGEEQ